MKNGLVKKLGILGLAVVIGTSSFGMSRCTHEQIRATNNLVRLNNDIQEQQLEQEQREEQQREYQQEQAQLEQEQREEQQREYQQEQAQLPQNQRHFFACNYWKDFNGNGIADYPDEFAGIKNVFSVNEPLLLVDYDPFDKTGDSWKIDIYSPSGNLVSEENEKIPYNTATYQTKIKTRSLVQRGGYGDFRAVWFLNDDMIGEADFTITP